MSLPAIVLFWASIAAMAYTPFGYLICLRVLACLARRPVKRAPIRPAVSFIIPVHNGASTIRQKIENLRDLDYPNHLLQVIVVDDCSSDGGCEKLSGVECVRLDSRQGKPAALNAGLEIAVGEVIAFTDVGVMLEPDALAAAVQRFVDPAVACVSSEDVVISAGGVGEGEGLYTRIDTRLRRLESGVGSATGVSGSFYLVRRELCPPFPLDLATDMFSGLHCVDRGYRAVVEPSSKVRIYAQSDAAKEFDRKVRTMVTGLRAIMAFRHLLNPFRSGVFAWFLASHKMMRYLMPVFALSALFSSAYLAPSGVFYRCCFAAGMASMGIGFAQILMRTSSFAKRLPGAPGFFCASLVAAITAWYRFLSGERYQTWQPTERSVV